MAEKATKPDIRFIVTTKEPTWSGERTLELEAELVVMLPDGTVQYPRFGWSDDTGAGDWEGLKVRAHLYKSDREWIWDREPSFYGLYSVNQRQAEAMARRLKSAKARLEKLDSQLGYTRDLGSYLARLAIAVGCRERECFGRLSAEARTWDSARWIDAAGLQFHLQHTESEWRKKWGFD